MSDHDILSDAEREALGELSSVPELPPQRVLIVDDDKDARELLAEILALDGIRCVTAASGEEALNMLMPDTDNRRRIGLVITDLRMANIGGLELIRQVRESTRAAMPIIIVSGDADVKDAIEAMHLSVVDFLLKPIDTAKLLGLVKHELGIADRSHALRGNASTDAPRSALEGTRSVPGCVPTRSEGTIKQQKKKP